MHPVCKGLKNKVKHQFITQKQLFACCLIQMKVPFLGYELLLKFAFECRYMREDH